MFGYLLCFMRFHNERLVGDRLWKCIRCGRERFGWQQDWG
jgi:ubiquitin C-terminal hydrolase